MGMSVGLEDLPSVTKEPQLLYLLILLPSKEKRTSSR